LCSSKKHRLRVHKSRLLRRIYRPKGQEVKKKKRYSTLQHIRTFTIYTLLFTKYYQGGKDAAGEIVGTCSIDGDSQTGNNAMIILEWTAM
jgi:hypothetical protein